MNIYVTPSGGVDLDTVRPGETQGNPLNVDQLFVPGFLSDNMRLNLLKGEYSFPEDATLDLRAYTGVLVYGVGMVTVLGNEALDPAINLGSGNAIGGINFEDCLQPVVIEDGETNSLIHNCIDYVTLDNIKGKSFEIGVVNGCTAKNLTSRRNCRGMQFTAGTKVRNCLATNRLGVPRADLSGRLKTLFPGEATPFFKESYATGNIQQHAEYAMESETASVGLITNKDAGSQMVSMIRLHDPMDFSVLDRILAVFNLIDLGDYIPGSTGIQIWLGSSLTDYFGWTIPANDLVLGFDSLVCDLTAPVTTSGTNNLAAITMIGIGIRLTSGGSARISLDHIAEFDTTLDIDYNSIEVIGTGDPFEEFRGTNGNSSVPPFQSPHFDNLGYDPTSSLFGTFMAGGEDNAPIGAIFQGCHAGTNEVPGLLNFTNHPWTGPWENDESFFDTTAGVVGPEGEGDALTIDESTAVITVLNGETNTIVMVADDLRVRDADDDRGQGFIKTGGIIAETGIVYTFAAAPTPTAGSIGVAGEIKISSASMADVLAAGATIKVESTGGGGGSHTLIVPKTELIAGWNRLELLFASPTSSAGAFDVTTINKVTVSVATWAASTITDLVIDHLYLIKTVGPITGRMIFTSGVPTFDLTLEPLAEVGRYISQPFLCTSVNGILRAAWGAVENDAIGAVVNIGTNLQQRTTRTIEIRFSDFSFTKYGVLQGSSKQEWTDISRVQSISADAVDIWCQFRITHRNRLNFVV